MRRWLLIAFVLAWGCGDDAAKPGAVPPAVATQSPSPSDAGTDTDATFGIPAPNAPVDAGATSSPLIDARPYRMTVPSKYDATVPTPLVLLLHGYTATSKVQDDYFRISALAEAKTFLVALPEGRKDSVNNQFWAATDACCNFDSVDVDDVAYLTAVLADVKSKFNVDRRRVYVIGHSNGGFMANRLACERAKEIAAIVSFAGAVFADATKCSPEEPVAVLQIHGTNDAVIRYEGGNLRQTAYPGAVATVATWASKNGCATTLEATGTTLDLNPALAGEETKVERHGCTKGAAELWTMNQAGHVPALRATFAETAYAFLEAHPKP